MAKRKFLVHLRRNGLKRFDIRSPNVLEKLLERVLRLENFGIGLERIGSEITKIYPNGNGYSQHVIDDGIFWYVDNPLRKIHLGNYVNSYKDIVEYLCPSSFEEMIQTRDPERDVLYFMILYLKTLDIGDPKSLLDIRSIFQQVLVWRGEKKLYGRKTMDWIAKILRKEIKFTEKTDFERFLNVKIEKQRLPLINILVSNGKAPKNLIQQFIHAMKSVFEKKEPINAQLKFLTTDTESYPLSKNLENIHSEDPQIFQNFFKTLVELLKELYQGLSNRTLTKEEGNRLEWITILLIVYFDKNQPWERKQHKAQELVANLIYSFQKLGIRHIGKLLILNSQFQNYQSSDILGSFIKNQCKFVVQNYQRELQIFPFHFFNDVLKSVELLCISDPNLISIVFQTGELFHLENTGDEKKYIDCKLKHGRSVFMWSFRFVKDEKKLSIMLQGIKNSMKVVPNIHQFPIFFAIAGLFCNPERHGRFVELLEYVFQGIDYVQSATLPKWSKLSYLLSMLQINVLPDHLNADQNKTFLLELLWKFLLQEEIFLDSIESKDITDQLATNQLSLELFTYRFFGIHAMDRHCNNEELRSVLLEDILKFVKRRFHRVQPNFPKKQMSMLTIMKPSMVFFRGIADAIILLFNLFTASNVSKDNAVLMLEIMSWIFDFSGQMKKRLEIVFHCVSKLGKDSEKIDKLIPDFILQHESVDDISKLDHRADFYFLLLKLITSELSPEMKNQVVVPFLLNSLLSRSQKSSLASSTIRFLFENGMKDRNLLLPRYIEIVLQEKVKISSMSDVSGMISSIKEGDDLSKTEAEALVRYSLDKFENRLNLLSTKDSQYQLMINTLVKLTQTISMNYVDLVCDVLERLVKENATSLKESILSQFFAVTQKSLNYNRKSYLTLRYVKMMKASR